MTAAQRKALLLLPCAYEEAVKMLGEFAQVARDAKRAAGTLDEKVRFSRHAERIEEARRILLRGLLDYQDAHKLAEAAQRCEGCGEVQQGPA